MLTRKRQFITTLVLLVAGGFLATSLVSYFAAQRSLGRQISETTLPLTSDNVYSEIQRDLLRPIFISSLMASDTFVRDWVLDGERDPQRMVRYLGEIRDRYRTVTSFFVSDRSRVYYHPNGVHRVIDPQTPRDAWYYRVRDMKTPYEINVDLDEVNRDRVTIFINYRVHDYAGRYIGATGVGLALDSVAALLADYQQRYGRSIYFVDRVGRITLRGAGHELPTQLRDIAGMASIATQLLTSPSSAQVIERDGGKVYVNSRLIPEFDWFLVVEQDAESAANAVHHTLLWNLAICLALTAIVLYLANLTLSAYQRRLEEMAANDKLTGLANRQSFDLVAEQILRQAQRRGSPLAIAVCDIDDFKQINDAYGHLAGDEVIRTVAQLVRQSAREADVVCRWGGEEFLVLLVDCDLAHAQPIAERLRESVAATPVLLDSKVFKVEVQVSVGLAALRTGDGLHDLIHRADVALYDAKEHGKNRVAMAPMAPMAPAPAPHPGS